MKDIKVITRHAPSNYGSLLQSIATIEVIEKLGCKCTIIDYKRKDERGLSAVLTDIKRKGQWSNSPLKKLIYLFVRFPMEICSQIKFDGMRKKYLNLTKRCSTLQDLEKLQADLFVTGSDQVWGPIANEEYDEAYFLSFVKGDIRKIAFSASFGKAEFNDRIVVQYKKHLSKYDKITVRENSATALLNNWDVNCLGQVLDPTLLLTDREWSRFISKEIGMKYVLVYQMHRNDKMDEYAKKFAKEVGLPLLRISPSFQQFTRGGKFIYLPNIGTFLSYIKHCSYLITDSFHGTVFAINFNRQLIEILPENETNSRNRSILQLTGLIDRIVSNYSDFSVKDKFIDYTAVNQIINAEREHSIVLMSEMINN